MLITALAFRDSFDLHKIWISEYLTISNWAVAMHTKWFKYVKYAKWMEAGQRLLDRAFDKVPRPKGCVNIWLYDEVLYSFFGNLNKGLDCEPWN